MMSLLLSDCADPVRKRERFLEVRKLELLLQVMLFHDVPFAPELSLKILQRLAPHRRNAPLAGNTGLVGERIGFEIPTLLWIHGVVPFICFSTAARNDS